MNPIREFTQPQPVRADQDIKMQFYDVAGNVFRSTRFDRDLNRGTQFSNTLKLKVKYFTAPHIPECTLALFYCSGYQQLFQFSLVIFTAKELLSGGQFTQDPLTQLLTHILGDRLALIEFQVLFTQTLSLTTRAEIPQGDTFPGKKEKKWR